MLERTRQGRGYAPAPVQSEWIPLRSSSPADGTEYVLTAVNYGQGEGLTVFPVSQIVEAGTPQHENSPYTIPEVLTKGSHEDFALVLGRYLEQEAEQLRKIACFQGAESFRLLSHRIKRTESAINQPTNATVVDVIAAGKIRAEGVTRNEPETNGQDIPVRRQTEWVRDGHGGQRQLTVVYAWLDFRIRYILDLRPCERKCIGPIIMIRGMEGDDPVFRGRDLSTNEYLLPVMYAEDYERTARAMIAEYFPEARRADFVTDGDELAARMGLRVKEVRFADKTVVGQIFFDSETVELLDDAGKSRPYSPRPGTILISKDHCTTVGIRSGTIAHECAHFYLDRSFFLLQRAMGRPFRSYVSRRRERKRDRGGNSPVDWMELQAEKLPAYLLMERESTLAFVEAERLKWKGKPTPDVWRRILFAAAEHFHVSAAMAKIRLVELGYSEMRGVYNYLNGTAVPNHSCSGTWEKGLTYTISSADAAALAGRSAAFDRLLRSGGYRYAEGHFCLCAEKYLLQNCHGQWCMTEYGRRHIDECCLAFTASGRHRETQYRAGVAAHNRKEPVTDRYLCGYRLAAEPGTKEYAEENDVLFEDGSRWAELLFHLPDTLFDTVRAILSRKNITREELAQRLGIDRKTLYDALHAANPKTGCMVAVCIAMGLPYYISIEIVEKFGPRLRNTELDNLFRQMLLEADRLTIARCEELLRTHKLPGFFKSAE